MEEEYKSLQEATSLLTAALRKAYPLALLTSTQENNKASLWGTIWMPNNHIRTHQKCTREPVKDNVAWGSPQPQLDHLPWHLGQTHMPSTALNMGGLHHHSLRQSHFSSNSPQMALFILVLKLLTGAMLLQQHLIRGVCTRHGSGKKGGLQLPKGRGGNSNGGDSASLEWHYACCLRWAQFFCQHPPASEPWQIPHEGGVPWQAQRDMSCSGCSVGWLILLPTSWGGLLGAHV